MRAERQLLKPLRTAIIGSPPVPLMLVAVGLFVWAASRSAGYYPTTWYPLGLLLLGLLVVAAIALPAPTPPAPVVAAAAALAAYAAWSYLSIAWAAQKGDAWDGANRTAVYAIVFALFAFWRARAHAAAAIAGIFGAAIAVLGCVELVGALTAAHPAGYFFGGQFSAPAGYQNADVALWFAAFWPCVALAARREVHPAARGALVAGAVILAGLALLAQSRGWAVAAPLTVLAFLAIVPGRVRTTLTLCLVAAAVGACAPAVLHVYDVAGRPAFRSSVRDAASALLIAALCSGLAVAAIAVVDRRVRVPRRYARASAAALVAAAVIGAGVGVGVFVAHEGSPISAASRAWRSFKRTSTPHVGRSRFLQSLGSNRYDFWRVAWGRFTSHPVAGIGADNFQEAYLARRRSDEEPRYPHSVELRTLSQTGIVGALLLGFALVAALWGALRAIRRRGAFGGAVVAGAVGVCAYWLLHGSVDWLWEFAGLGVPACAMLGLAAGMVPRPAVRRSPPRVRPPRARRPAITAAVGAGVAVALGVTLLLPWLSTLESDAAVSTWPAHPRRAFDQLDTAASLNPLTADPKLIAGTIAVRLGRDGDARRYFSQAIARDPGSEYAHLELGLLLAEAGRRRQSVASLTQASALNPRDDIARFARRRVAEGRRISAAAINNQIVQRARERLR